MELQSRPLSFGAEVPVDSLFYDRAILSRRIDQQDQVLVLAVFAYRVTMTDRFANGSGEPLAEPVQHRPVFHRIAFAIDDRADHQVDRLSASADHSLQDPVDPLEHRQVAQISARSIRILSTGEERLDLIDHPVFWTSDDICHIPMPIDVYEVYKEYGYTDNIDISKNSLSENSLHQPIS